MFFSEGEQGGRYNLPRFIIIPSVVEVKTILRSSLCRLLAILLTPVTQMLLRLVHLLFACVDIDDIYIYILLLYIYMYIDL